MAEVQLSASEMRQGMRHRVYYPVIAEHLGQGMLALQLVNISRHGFMIDHAPKLERADRVIVPLPVIGCIEGFCVWAADTRAGFQFERIIARDIFAAMIQRMQTSPR